MNKIHQKNRKEDHPLVSRYVNYLRDVRGLAENSVLVYTPYVRDLVADQVAKKGAVFRPSVRLCLSKTTIYVGG